MSTSDIDSVKDKIRKLLALGSNAGAMEGEIDNALRFARTLMLKHQLSEADCQGTETLNVHEAAAYAEATEYARESAYSQGVSLSQWESNLTSAITRLVGTVRWYYQRHQHKRSAAGTLEYDRNGKNVERTKIQLYGPAEDVRDALTMIDEWSQVIASMARMKFGGALRGEGRSYAEGFTESLLNKVAELRRAEQQIEGGGLGTLPGSQERSSALVLINANAVMRAKLDKGQEYLKSLGVRLGSGGSRPSGRYYGGAHAAGRADGAKANLSRQQTRKIR